MSSALSELKERNPAIPASTSLFFHERIPRTARKKSAVEAKENTENTMSTTPDTNGEAPVPNRLSTTSQINENASQNNELAAVIDDLLAGLTTKFATVSAEILGKMDDMSRRLDTLEATIQAGQNRQSGRASPSKT